MQATTARCLDGGSGSGPAKDVAERSLLASSSSVAVMAPVLSDWCAPGPYGVWVPSGAMLIFCTPPVPTVLNGQNPTPPGAAWLTRLYRVSSPRDRLSSPERQIM